MRLLSQMAAAPLSEALGWTLFHSLWQGALIASALSLVLVVTRSSRIRYATACLALLAMLTGFVLTLIHLLPEDSGSASRLIGASFFSWRQLAAPSRTGDLLDLRWLIPWLTPFWLVGVSLFYLHSAAGWLPLSRLRRRGVLEPASHWQALVDRLAVELKISRAVLLLESMLADTPLVMGHVRPVILTPLGFLTGLSPDQVEVILLHELAHIRRSDYLVNCCQRLLEGFLFYHPAAWWISRVIRAEREHSCDDTVVALRGNAHGYAVALTALEQSRQEQAWQTVELTVAATGGNLMNRIKRLLYPERSSGLRAPALAALVLVAGTSLALAWQLTPTATGDSVQASEPTESAWQKWLNEDVVYLISERERSAFEGLRTDEERQHFVEQFWERRDPTPGTAENEFKEEHYRRVAFANKHFRTPGGTPGWRTDRGHTSIVYGPPDEIDAHPRTAGNSKGMETWLYRHIDGLGDTRVFTFVDQNGTGEYFVAPSADH